MLVGCGCRSEEELFRSVDFFNAILKELGYLPNRLVPQHRPSS
jgi:hypothetical protein